MTSALTAEEGEPKEHEEERKGERGSIRGGRAEATRVGSATTTWLVRSGSTCGATVSIGSRSGPVATVPVSAVSVSVAAGVCAWIGISTVRLRIVGIVVPVFVVAVSFHTDLPGGAVQVRAGVLDTLASLAAEARGTTPSTLIGLAAVVHAAFVGLAFATARCADTGAVQTDFPGGAFDLGAGVTALSVGRIAELVGRALHPETEIAHTFFVHADFV